MSASIIGPTSLSGGGLPPSCDYARVEFHPGQRSPARSQAVQRRAHLVDVGDHLRIQRRYHQAAPAGVDHESILLQQPQRLQHRLPGYVQGSRQLLLRDAGARREIAVADRVEQALVDLFGQVGGELDTADGGHSGAAKLA